MREINKVTGQRIDHKDSNDNAPPGYSAPRLSFKCVLLFHADNNCWRCGGTGYIGSFKRYSGGRCFQCLPDDYWRGLLGELELSGSDAAGQIVCEVRHVDSPPYVHEGYIVTRVGVPPIGAGFPIFSTTTEACNYARQTYNI